ncbi:MAG: RNA 2',3'-cyclic phosphodiesterase [Planctomycetales bacterium]
MLRTFIAARIPLHPQLEQLHASLERIVPELRPVRLSNLHVTLKFLGETGASQVPAVVKILSQTAAATPSGVLHLQGVGAFPSTRRPSIVWIGIRPADFLGPLVERLHQDLRGLGFLPETRPFHPHVTLLRIKQPVPPPLRQWLSDHEQTDFGTVPIQEVVLMQSHLNPEGATYTLLASAPLAKGSAAE